MADEQLGEVAGGEPVVAVEEGQVLAARGVEPGVAGGGQPAVLLVSDIHRARELALRAREDVRGLVARTVVDENEFEVLAARSHAGFSGCRARIVCTL